MSISQKLEVIQKTLGITQTELARKLGVSFVSLNRWKNGLAAPRPKKLDQIDALFLEVTGQKAIPTDVLTYKKKLLYQKSVEFKNVGRTILESPDIHDEFVLKLTYNSNAIEGSTLTEPDTAAILFDNAALPNRSLIEHLEAKNHQAALEYLFNYIVEGGPLNETLVLKLHGMLMNGIRPDAGKYRDHGVRILGVNLATANYLSIPKRMKKIMEQATQRKEDTLAQSAQVHSSFEQVHPFSDGNGRVGRLLMNAMLLRANIAPAVVQQKHKRLYYAYLYKAQSSGNHDQLEDFLCEAVADGFKILERQNVN